MLIQFQEHDYNYIYFQILCLICQWVIEEFTLCVQHHCRPFGIGIGIPLRQFIGVRIPRFGESKPGISYFDVEFFRFGATAGKKLPKAGIKLAKDHGNIHAIGKAQWLDDVNHVDSRTVGAGEGARAR